MVTCISQFFFSIIVNNGDTCMRGQGESVSESLAKNHFQLNNKLIILLYCNLIMGKKLKKTNEKRLAVQTYM